MESPRKTPLYDCHIAQGARMIDFSGWLMPVQYTGIVEEHRSTRQSAGLFDLFHMGEFTFRGPNAEDAVQYLTTNDVSRLKPGDIQYSLLCRQDGGIVDDVLVYRFPDHFMLVVNAANTTKDLAWIKDNLPEGVSVTDESLQTGLIAIQGPNAERILGSLTGADLDALFFYHFVEDKVAEVPTVISRTGYTGEDGFELYYPSCESSRLWNALMEKGREFGLVPVGLGARDTLRLEMKYSLYGNDITEENNPYEAGLGWVVKVKKGDFIGREALLSMKERPLPRKLVGFEVVGRGIARSHYTIFVEDEPVGEVTSGSYSPTLDKNIGLGYVKTAFTEPGTKISIDIRGRKVPALVVPTPFVPSKTKVERRK